MEHVTSPITTENELSALCDRLTGVDYIAFDTEFVSEDTFVPELCLIQVATLDVCATIDTLAVKDLSQFWKLLSEGDHITIAHAAREELRFSQRAVQAAPANLFDTQIAAGIVGHDYPASYSALVSRYLRLRLDKGETRTDWRRRPLTQAQIRYALDDVIHLIPLYQKLQNRLEEHGRMQWLVDETAAWMQTVYDADTKPRWRRVSGIGSVSGSSLSIVRELWLWRQDEARTKNIPAKRILRDDLIIEIAKRKSADQEKIKSIRGLYRGTIKNYLSDIAGCAERGLETPVERSSRKRPKAAPSQLNLLGQFLTPALSSICRNAEVATSLAGTATHVRDLIAFKLGFPREDDSSPPKLATGWRAEVVGHLLEELLAGNKSIRIEDAKSDHPLAFEDVDG